MRESRTAICVAAFVQLMQWNKAVLLQPLTKDEADYLVSGHLEFFAGQSERQLNVIVEDHCRPPRTTTMRLKSLTAPVAVKEYEARPKG